jgi:predicted nucleic acid-binding protein
MPDRPPSAVDTVVLLYFLLVEESHLLLALVGEPLWVPPSVYDPSEQNVPHEALRRPELLSEIRQAIRHYEVEEQRHADPRGPAQRLRVADTLHAEGRLKVFELDARELLLAAQLQSREGAAAHGLRAPLGPGEAACLAVAWLRGWTLVTDDTDALKVLESLAAGAAHPYDRIRRLLMRAADSDLITKERSNEIHREMQSFGFWDSVLPFP